MIAILADAFVKATILLLVAAAGTLVLRRSSAAMRHLVWALACAGVLVLPVASALLPTWRVPAWPSLDMPVASNAEQIAGEARTASRPAEQTRVNPAPSPSVVEAHATPAATVADEAVRFRLTTDWTALVFPIWLSGVVVVLLLVALGMTRIAWLDRVTQPAQDESWLLLVEELSRELGLTRSVRVLQAQAPAMPMTWGSSAGDSAAGGS
jgi:hypothetical protein